MYQVYKVLEGENLESLAKKFKTTKEEILNLNGNLKESEISNGYIIVPNTKENVYDTYKIQKGDTIYSIAKKYSVPVDLLLILNGLKETDYIYPGENLLLPKENVYITKEETLDDIRRKTGMTFEEILAQNSDLIVLPNQIIRY